MKTIKKILMLVLIVVLITGGCSAIEDSKVSSTTESTIADNLLEYKWIDSLGEHTVYIALDEVAIIPSDTQLGPVEIDSLVKKFDDKAVIIKKNDPVIFVKMSSFFSLKDLENKTSNFKKGTGNKANLAFYDSPIKDERPGAITGEIFVSFDKKMDKNSIKAWAKNENLDLIKSFEFSQNTYLFDAGADIISLEITNRIFKSDTIIYAYPNLWKSIEYKSVPNDLLFPNQWHLRNTGQGGGTPGEDVKIETVWDSFKGSPNEVIAIVDDGLEIGHVDLAPNIIPGLSWDYVDNNGDPTGGSHGTSVAGVAAARGNNTNGVASASWQSGLVGHRMSGYLDDEADALQRNKNIVDIYSNSWGPYDDRRLAGPGPLTIAALQDGATNGRNGLGNIYVWAGGNGNSQSNYLLSDNANYDGYANSRYTNAIAASNNLGKQSYYSEEGANILVNTPSNGGTQGITTTDRTGALGYNAGDYTSTFGGTSSAAPLASGIISLLLQANPNIGWRDVRLILAQTADKNDPTDADWTTNGAGYPINHKYGFGRINASKAISTAQTWTNAASEVMATGYSSPNSPIPDNSQTGITNTISIPENIKTEFVEVVFTAADHTYWGDLEIELVSPSGTSSFLAKKHNVAFAGQYYNGWKFGSVRHIGESSQGNWQLIVRDLKSGNTGTFQNWRINIYGTDQAAQCNDRWDVNQDGVANVLDMILIGQHFLETTSQPYPNYDVNIDGTVNVLDLVLVGQHFGQQSCYL